MIHPPSSRGSETAWRDDNVRRRVVIEGERIVIPTRLGHVKWARILSTYESCHPSWAERDFRLLSLQGLAWRESLKFCHLPFASTALQFTIPLRVVRRIRRDKCWAIGELVLSLEVNSGRGGRHGDLMYILYFPRISPRSHGKKSRSFLLDEVVYDWQKRPVLYIYVCKNTSNFPPVLFLWYWDKREDILSFPPVLIAFIVLIVFRDV